MAFYTFDPNGNLPANLVVNEQHVLNTINGVDHQYIVPRDAPFYNESMQVVDEATGEFLTPVTDFDFGYPFEAGLDEVGKNLSGAIYLTDVNRTGTFRITYRTLGGDFVTATTRAIANGLLTLNDLTTTSWDDIAPGTIPTEWPATPHTQSVNDVEAVDRLSAALENLEALWSTTPPYIKVADIQDLDTQFLTPLITALSNIALAITDNGSKTIFHERAILPQSPDVELGANVDTWQDIGLALAVAKDGTYRVTHSINPLFKTGENPRYQLRYVISTDGGTVYNTTPYSYTNGLPEGLVTGWIIKIQIKFLDTHTGVIVSSDTVDTETSSGFSLERLGS